MPVGQHPAQLWRHRRLAGRRRAACVVVLGLSAIEHIPGIQESGLSLCQAGFSGSQISIGATRNKRLKICLSGIQGSAGGIDLLLSGSDFLGMCEIPTRLVELRGFRLAPGSEAGRLSLQPGGSEGQVILGLGSRNPGLSSSEGMYWRRPTRLVQPPGWFGLDLTAHSTKYHRA